MGREALVMSLLQAVEHCCTGYIGAPFGFSLEPC